MDLQQDLVAIAFLVGYYLAFAIPIALLSAFLPEAKREPIRKSYHIFASLSIIIILRFFSTWYSALISVLLIMVTALVLVVILEKFKAAPITKVKRYSKKSEIPFQIGYICIVLIVLLTLFWGILGDEFKFIAAIGVVAWGFGDATSALVGKSIGRNQLKQKIFDGKKTQEGTIAGTLAASAGVFAVLLFFNPLAIPGQIVLAIFAGITSAVVEASSRKGIDTLTVPLFVCAGATPVYLLFNYLEGLF